MRFSNTHLAHNFFKYGSKKPGYKLYMAPCYPFTYRFIVLKDGDRILRSEIEITKDIYNNLFKKR